jgi:hypothetical protein
VKTCLDQVGAGRKSCIVYTKLGSLDSIRRPTGFERGHVSGRLIPADSMAEFEDRVE